MEWIDRRVLLNGVIGRCTGRIRGGHYSDLFVLFPVLGVSADVSTGEVSTRRCLAYMSMSCLRSRRESRASWVITMA